MSIKKYIGRLLRRTLPRKYYKLLANGFIIVPSYYKEVIAEAEKYFDLALEDSDEKSMMLIRKYGHIIDKGLHREDATPGHSNSVYAELKKLLDKLQGTAYSEDPTFKWAEEKLAYYEMLQSQPWKFKPLGKEPIVSTLTYEQLFALVKERRSNRIFLDKVVTDDVITKLKSVSNWAASSCNKQPIRLFVTNNTDLAKRCLKCCAGGTGFGKNIPSFWAFTANVRGYIYPSEMFLPSIDTSLGAQNVFLAAQTLGLTGTILSWGQHKASDDANLRELLGIPADYSIIFCAVIGYAESSYLTPCRKNVI